jgi:CRP-like cAMP-binding protein
VRNEFHQVLDKFLKCYCPNSDQIRAAIDRVKVCGIDEKRNDEIICREDDVAECFWLILEGSVDVFRDGEMIRQREVGELIGEQAFLKASTPCRGDATRTATMKAHGSVKLLRFDAAFLEHLNAEEKATWFQTLAHVVNQKLEQASQQRTELHGDVAERDKLLERFCDQSGLRIVRLALDNEENQISDREVYEGPELKAVIYLKGEHRQ